MLTMRYYIDVVSVITVGNIYIQNIVISEVNHFYLSIKKC